MSNIKYTYTHERLYQGDSVAEYKSKVVLENGIQKVAITRPRPGTDLYNLSFQIHNGHYFNVQMNFEDMANKLQEIYSDDLLEIHYALESIKDDLV